MERLHLHLSIALALALGAVGCGNQNEETSGGTPSAESQAEPASAQGVAAELPPITLASIASRIGGARVLAGRFGVELLPQASGQIKLVLSKGDGSAVEDANVTVAMQGADGQQHDVSLAWDAGAAAYVGTMPGGPPHSGPCRVSVTAGGATGEAQIPTIAVAPEPLYGGQVLVLGDLAAEVKPEADGTVLVTAIGPSGVVDGSAGVDFQASVKGSDGATHDVSLVWDAPSLAFVGALPEGVALATGELALHATVGGVEHVAGIPTLAVKAPAYDGDVIAVADMNVEVVPAGAGGLDLYVSDATGAAVTGAAEVTLELPGLPAPVPVTWDAAAGRYHADIAADVDVSTAPVCVRVVHQGRARRGGIAVAAGRALGVGWRARLSAGAGGAIPPGHAPRLVASNDLRARIAARGGATAAVDVGAMGVHGRGNAASVMVTAPSAMVDIRGTGAAATVEVHGAAATAQAQAAAAHAAAEEARLRAEAARMVTVSVMAPPPPSVMVSAGASAGGSTTAMSTTGTSGASVMGGASVMLGF